MIKKKIQPPFLKPGDEVAVISPSFCIDENILYDSIKLLEQWGLRVRIGKNAFRKNGPFAGSDEERLSDFQEMTDDRDIRAVFCSRGGYGLSRIIDKIDFSALDSNPKWYSGFSDITVLHLWLSEVCGIISVHGEMPLNFNSPDKTPDTFITLRKALFGELSNLEWEGDFYKQRNAKGEITGGNLSLLYSLAGTPAEPETKGKILFIEEVGEYFYHIDRMLTSLRLSGKLEDLSALIIGGMNKLEDAKIPWGKTIEETILDILSGYQYPVLFNFPAGHISDNRAFYIGKKAEIQFSDQKAILQYI
jgi:muramoyltetrapeptide carboxypeptidase